jgi:peptidyl-prolyl cis-trans isomerase A (cyclophilin A)
MSRLFAAAAFAALALTLAPAYAQTATLNDPKSLAEQAPATFTVLFDTSKGPVTIAVTRAWAPNGADRFYNLVKNGFYDNARFFRVLPGFVVQFGINADPKVSSAWRQATIPDDPVTQSNKRGYLTFATSGPNTRTTQVFIDLADNTALDRQGFAPFGVVSSGLDTVDKLYPGYGEGAPNGRGPDQNLIQLQGNAYLAGAFGNLDYIKKATIQ